MTRFLTMLCLLACISCSSKRETGLKFIDNYLVTWDRFAQGANGLAPQIKADRLRFETELATALKNNDKRAPSRLVFYTVVQVGGFIRYESALGSACEHVVGAEVPIFTSQKKERMYFAGDLFFWWETNKSKFEAYALLDEWRERDFAKSTVIPMYESAVKQR